MKKRITALLLAALLPVFGACGAANEEKTPEETPAETPASETTGLSASETKTPTPETSAPTPETSAPTPESTTPLTPEQQRDLDDRAFLATFDYPSYEPGNEGEAYFLGRWIEKTVKNADGEEIPAHVTVTDGSQIFFMTRGCTSVELDFTMITKLETPYFAVSIDGSSPVRQLITSASVKLPDDGRHVLRIVADGMTEREDKWQGEIGFCLSGISLPEGGSMRQIIPKNKLVFFYGDSITEGVKTLGDNTSNGNSASSAYPWYVCENLGAIPYYVGYGASGVTCAGSFNTFIIAIDKLSRQTDVDFSVKPDLIVVNHGTNDNAAQSTAFKNGLKKAIARLQKRYPDVPVIIMIPFGQYHAADIREVCADIEGVQVLETKTVSFSMPDGLHPNKSSSITGGKKLAALIRELTGEEFFKID